MNLVVSLYVALLFVLLTPGILLTLPKGGKKLTVAIVHGLVFAAVYHFTHKMVWRLSVSMDGFRDGDVTKAPTQAGYAAAAANALSAGVGKPTTVTPAKPAATVPQKRLYRR